MKRCTKLHQAYADAVAHGCMAPPRTEFEHLLYGVKPITAESTVILSTRIEGGRIAAHRYLPRAPKGTPPEVARAYHAWLDEKVPWVEGPPPFVREGMRAVAP